MKFYTAEDLQQIMQIGHKQAEALMRAEGFPSIRIGRSYRVEEDALSEWLSQTKSVKLDYDSWGSTLKNKILKAYKSYGFSKGGVVRKGIPASILDMIGVDALIPRGDSMLIGANPGETVLTEEFTKQLKPTAQILNEFNRRMAQTTMEPSAAVQNKTTEITSENHFIFNNPVIKSEEDAEKLMEKAIQKHMDRNRRDWKKVR